MGGYAVSFKTKISITLPADRTKQGRLWLFMDEGLVGLADIPCLGKADNARAALEGNPSRDPLKPYGDTPTGRYRAVKAEERKPPHHRMGRYVIPLIGHAGDALLATSPRDGLPTRTGLYIHGGPAEAKYDAGLVPTLGCIRLRNRDIAMLFAKLDGMPVEIEIEEEPAARPEKETV
jgi:hypothetical protein